MAGGRRGALIGLAACALAAFGLVPWRTLDDFADVSAWTAAPSEGVRLVLSGTSGEEGARALRFDFDFAGHAGWAAARRDLPLRLPANWALELRLRGEAAPETIEIKLIDETGKNVWWSVRRDFAFPRDWTTLRVRKRQVSFAWGPDRQRPLRDLGAIEITVTASAGGRGWLEVASLRLEELPEGEPPLPEPVTWTGPADRGESQTFVLDLGGRREIGGLVLDWDAEDYPRRYAIEGSLDGARFDVLRTLEAAGGTRAWIYLPDTEAAKVRLRLEESARGRGYALRRLAVLPAAAAESPTAFLQTIARDSPRGAWPRPFAGEQLYWALVGVDGASDRGLLSEDGALEVGRGAFSLEPFLFVDGAFLGWETRSTRQSLADGDLPIPSVVREYANGVSLEVAAFTDGGAATSTLHARYRVRNAGAARRVTLSLALRPVQVNPPWQFLATPGGFAAIRGVSWDGVAAATADGRRVIPRTPPSAFGASPLSRGEIVSWLTRHALPPETGAEDPDGFASAALAWELDLPPNGGRDVIVDVPVGTGAAGASATAPGDADPARGFARRRDEAARRWREKLDRVRFAVPPEAEPAIRTLRSNLAWILVNRDGPALRPGSRSYARSWIRDGALMAAALLRLGHADAARDYLRWYAPYTFDSGAVPCCVDRRGADPVPEYDSHGELLYLAGEVFRYTGDRALIAEVWPRLSKAACHIDALRGQRRTEEFRTGEKRLFFGLLPESISHEGYSDHPVHSYWDDFWAVRGLSDAVELARALGRADDAAAFSRSRDELRADLLASIRGVIAARGLAYVPGSADLGDFDATSTTIALDPAGIEATLPPAELRNTFDRYWDDFAARRRAGAAGREYTPYEWRIAGTFLRLDEPDRADALTEFFLADRRPLEWNQWPEVVFRDAREPRFLGDLPHSWVGADFIRATLDRFAYERERDGSLVIAAGVPEAWRSAKGGVSVRGLVTRYGPLDLSVRSEAAGVRVTIGGGVKVPPGGFVLRCMRGAGRCDASIGGRLVSASADGEVVVRSAPAEVLLRLAPR